MMTHAHSSPPKSHWPELKAALEKVSAQEPALGKWLKSGILKENDFIPALTHMLGEKLGSAAVSAETLREILASAYALVPGIEKAVSRDLLSVTQHDPAAHDLVTPFLYFKGFHAIETHRAAHALWHNGRKPMALFLQSRISELFDVDIHPAVPVGQGVMFDHASGIVVGETAVIEDDVLIWQGVTLGNKLPTSGDRHPKVRRGARIGAGSLIIGAVEIGAGAQVAAGSVVLENVPAGATVAGVPARVVS